MCSQYEIFETEPNALTMARERILALGDEAKLSASEKLALEGILDSPLISDFFLDPSDLIWEARRLAVTYNFQ